MKKATKSLIHQWKKIPFLYKILIGIIIGTILGIYVKDFLFMEVCADLFIGSLKAIAPILVFFLICSSLAQSSNNIGQKMLMVVGIYMITTFIAASCAIAANYFFPVTITLEGVETEFEAAKDLNSIILDIFNKLMENPISAVANANYLGTLFWSVLIGFSLKKIASETTIKVFSDISSVVTRLISLIISLAPLGIMGLVYKSISSNGLGIFTEYGKLILIIVGTMLFVALVVNPTIAGLILKRNPYPLVFLCFKYSGIPAFFTRSSAANIPVNLRLCEKLRLDKEFYSLSITLGSTINLNGAAVTITIFTLVICNTLGIYVHPIMAFLLCIMSVMAACGASSVAGGSLFLIPLSCSLFGIEQDIAMQGVLIGFIIGIIQDSFETAINSSSDVIFTAVTQYYERKRQHKDLDYLGKFREK